MISAIIIFIGGTIFTSIYIFIKSIYEKVAFKAVAFEVINYFKSKTEINNLILWISIIIVFWSIFIFSKTVVKKFRNKKNEGLEDEIEELPRLGETSTALFSYRLAGSKLRIRYLSEYNFIISAKQSPFNSQKFDRESYDYFNAILKGEKF